MLNNERRLTFRFQDALLLNGASQQRIVPRKDNEKHNTGSEVTKFIHFEILTVCLSHLQEVFETSAIHFEACSNLSHGIFLYVLQHAGIDSCDSSMKSCFSTHGRNCIHMFLQVYP
jgi:hypothetical protein